jgi:hypothetical protein
MPLFYKDGKVVGDWRSQKTCLDRIDQQLSEEKLVNP